MEVVTYLHSQIGANLCYVVTRNIGGRLLIICLGFPPQYRVYLFLKVNFFSSLRNSYYLKNFYPFFPPIVTSCSSGILTLRKLSK